MKNITIRSVFAFFIIFLTNSCNKEEGISPMAPYIGTWELKNVLIHQYKDEGLTYDTTITTYAQSEKIYFEPSGIFHDSLYALISTWNTFFNTGLATNSWEVGADRASVAFDKGLTDVIMAAQQEGEQLNLTYWELANPQIADTSNFSYCNQMGDYYGASDATTAGSLTGYDIGYAYGHDYGFADGYADTYSTLDYDLYFAYLRHYRDQYFVNFFGGGDANFDSGHTAGYNDGYTAGAAFATKNDDGSIKYYELEYIFLK